jgi:hypothetical protein
MHCSVFNGERPELSQHYAKPFWTAIPNSEMPHWLALTPPSPAALAPLSQAWERGWGRGHLTSVSNRIGFYRLENFRQYRFELVQNYFVRKPYDRVAMSF